MTTVETINETMKQAQDYSRTHLGIKNGSDFSELVEVLRQSEEFKKFSKMAAMMGAMSIMLLPRKEDGDFDKKVDKFLDESPMTGIMADIFYMGYKVGRQESEIAELTKLAASE